MRNRSIGIVTLALAAGISAAPGAGAADPPEDCLSRAPYVGRDSYHEKPPPLTTTNLSVPVEVVLPWETAVCDGMSLTIRKADGTHLNVVPLTEHGGVSMPPVMTRWGNLSVPRATGAGAWLITKLSRGTESVNHAVAFTVLRGSTTTIDQPATVISPAKTVVTGEVRNYTATGSTAPSPGRKVQITHENPVQVIANTTTGTNGRYRVGIPFTRTTTVRAVAAATTTHAGSQSRIVTSRRYASMPRLSASPAASVNQWWKVTGTAYPGKLWTDLWVWDGTAWRPTSSFGPSAADGTFARWWKPSAPGTFRLKLTVGSGGVALENTPLIRELTVRVTSLQTQPTYLDGHVGPTSAAVVTQGTRMSSYGHLRVRHTTGALGPLAGQAILIQVRPEPTAPWENRGSARTTSTGYLYTNWDMPFGHDVEVRYVYTSPYVTIKDTLLNLGTVHVQ